MAVCHIPIATLTVSHNLPSLSPLSSLASASGNHRWRARGVSATSARGLIISCSSRNPCGGGKKRRTSRSNISDSDLCRELLNFVEVEGLPQGRVPSPAELAKRGRKDLANVVRRRGYKIIYELLRKQANERKLVEESFSENTDLGDKVCYRSSEAEKGGGYVSSEIKNDKAIANPYTVNSSRGEAGYGLIDSQDLSGEAKHDVSLFDIGSKYSKASESVETGLLTTAVPALRNDAVQDQGPRDDIGDNVSLVHDKDPYEQTDIDNLRAMLNKKEMELMELRQEIEKEKLALSTLKNRADAEVDYIMNLLSQKDVELFAAEEGLSGLKEVLIEYQGHGETVEVAGSFNGWHHPIQMDHCLSVNSSYEERNGSCWTATLWLYPGVYEIKFIVDGHWKTDPHREFVTRGPFTNNVLRVER